MNFDLDAKTRRALGCKLVDTLDSYFASLPDRAVQLPVDQRSLPPLPDSLPEFGKDALAVFDDVCRELVERGFHVPAANYFGLMNPAPAYMAVLAEALVAALNPQLASVVRSPLASSIEAQTVRWIGNRVGWDRPCNGTFTSGGNEANFSALAMALAWRFPGIMEEGVAMIGAPPVFYASSEAHHSLDKSAGLLGIGRRALRRIGVTPELQLDPEALDCAIREDKAAGRQPFAIVATAGTTSSGAIDDLPMVAEVARRYRLWFHVDGSYGAAAIFSDRHRYLVRGIEQADSITIDPHKWLAMPFAAGVVLTSHPEMLEQTFDVATPYMPPSASISHTDYFRISAQWSRRMNSLKLWLTLRVHGRLAYEELMEKQLRLARSFADWVEHSEHFELAAPQVLPVVNFRLKHAGRTPEETAAAHAALLDAVTASGRHWISRTRIAGQSVIRMMVISYLSEERHLQSLEETLLAAVQSLARTAK
jgi:glutamate/tyrosine decarboxylase-like PLP-dependent enzyme